MVFADQSAHDAPALDPGGDIDDAAGLPGGALFPTRMALLMKTARLVPARAWTALWARTSLT